MTAIIGDSWFVQVSLHDSDEETRRNAHEAFEHRDRTDFCGTSMHVALQLAWSKRGREVVANSEIFLKSHASHLATRAA